MPNALVLGASRGLGLGLVQEYLSRGWTVTASERRHSDALHATQATVLTADVTDPASVEALATGLTTPVDLLFVVSGIWGPAHQSPVEVTAQEVQQIFLTNAVAPVATAERLLPHLAPAATIAFMTSEMGSIGGNASGGAYLYRGSKAALNAMAKSFALSGGAKGKTVLALHPGWVQTDMGGPGASIDVATSVHGMADVLAREAGSGRFVYLDWQGHELPW